MLILSEGSYTKPWRFIHKTYQDDIPCSFSYKVVCVDDKFSKRIDVYRGENAAFEFIKAILKEYKHCRKLINRYFNENLIMTEEEEEHLFQESKSCWICKKLIDNDDEKVNLYTLSYKW